jgi:hypothetical protein
MNVQEFAALAEGDEIVNELNGSAGTITRTTPSGVHVVWGPRHEREMPFFYSVNGTAWFHWTKKAANEPDTATTADTRQAQG